jgi:pimeloyl-ACP methyl ester carboxylesterase
LEKWNFGYFSIIRFLLPWQREAKVRWFRSNYDDLIENRYAGLGPDNYPSVVAHSFGTYILGYALLKYRNIRLDKVILCGSILPRNFPWKEIIERGQVRELRNEYGVKDVWVRFVKWFVKGSGSSGENGFTENGFKLQSDRIIQEEFRFEHSEYFNRGHMGEFWIPFLLRPSDPVTVPVRTRPVPRPFSRSPIGLYFTYLIIGGGIGIGLSHMEFLESAVNDWVRPKRLPTFWCRIGDPGTQALTKRTAGLDNPFYIGANTGQCREDTVSISLNHNFQIGCSADGPWGSMNNDNPAKLPDCSSHDESGAMRR